MTTVQVDSAHLAGAANPQITVLSMQPQPDPCATVFYTLEARRRTGTYESALAGDAMIIHQVEDYGTAYSVDADVTPADVSNNEGSMFQPGEAWQSPASSRWVRDHAKTGDGFTGQLGSAASRERGGQCV